MASASVHRTSVKPANTLKGKTEQARVDAALKRASQHARQQLAAQGLKLPTQGWTRSVIRNPVV